MSTWFINASLFDGTGTKLRLGVSVEVKGDRIQAIHEAGGARPATLDHVIDLRDKVLMPGMFNLHCHLGWDGKHDLEQQSRFDGDLVYLKVSRAMRACLEAGVTTIRDLGVHRSALVAKKAVQSGLCGGPRIHSCGNSIMKTGGHTHWVGKQADGPDEIRKAVRDEVRAGADLIKVMATGFPTYGYTREEIQTAVDEAHMHGRKITVDAIWDGAARLAAECGVDSIEHGGDYGPETIDLLVRKGIWVVPTFSPLILQARFGSEWGMSPADVEKRRRTLENPVRLLGVSRCARAGVKIGFGTDCGSPVVPHEQIVPEMQALIEYGVFETTAQVLRCATLDSASLLGVGEDQGSIAPGKLADLVVIDGDPLVDLENLRRVVQVYIGGQMVVNHGQVCKGL